jgi:transposase
MAKPILDDALWELIEPHLPPPKRRRRRYPGRKPVPNRVALKGILFVLRTSLPWEYLPREMGCSGMTCWRRLRDWQQAGVWERIRRVLLGELRAADQIDWSRAVVDSASLRALKGGSTPAPIPRTAAGAARNTTCSPTRAASRSPARSPRRTVTT